MATEDFVIDESGDWHAVEHVLEAFPELHTVSSFAFIIKSINPIEVGHFVIATQQEEVVRVLDFVAQQQDDRLFY